MKRFLKKLDWTQHEKSWPGEGNIKMYCEKKNGKKRLKMLDNIKKRSYNGITNKAQRW